MSSSSPYAGINSYLTVISISVAFFLGISKLFDSKKVSRFATFLFLINFLMIAYLVLSNWSFRGVKRWIFINGFSYQPSELLKISFPVVLSGMFASNKWLPGFFFFFLSIICLLLQPDIGNSILVSMVGLAISFFWGLRKRFMILIFLLSCLIIGSFSIKTDYSSKRLRGFLQRNSHIPYQSFRAIQAIQNGGIFGTGAGRGQMKRFIPDAYSDFIFAVICEELGLIGCIAISGSFLVFFLSSMFLASKAARSIEGGSIFGLASTIFLQSWIHMASVVGIIPTKGITLPFISHGGSSLVASWIAVGMLIAMARNLKPYNQVDE